MNIIMEGVVTNTYDDDTVTTNAKPTPVVPPLLPNNLQQMS